MVVRYQGIINSSHINHIYLRGNLLFHDWSAGGRNKKKKKNSQLPHYSIYFMVINNQIPFVTLWSVMHLDGVGTRQKRTSLVCTWSSVRTSIPPMSRSLAHYVGHSYVSETSLQTQGNAGYRSACPSEHCWWAPISRGGLADSDEKDQDFSKLKLAEYLSARFFFEEEKPETPWCKREMHGDNAQSNMNLLWQKYGQSLVFHSSANIYFKDERNTVEAAAPLRHVRSKMSYRINSFPSPHPSCSHILIPKTLNSV